MKVLPLDISVSEGVFDVGQLILDGFQLSMDFQLPIRRSPMCMMFGQKLSNPAKMGFGVIVLNELGPSLQSLRIARMSPIDSRLMLHGLLMYSLGKRPG
jgi:hypothetical protein